MSFEKYRVHEVAKDFGKQTKDITQILTTYATTPKNHMQVLDDKELSIIFEYLTQHNQVADLQAVFANAPKAGEGAKNDRPRDNRDSGRKQGQQKRGEGNKSSRGGDRPARNDGPRNNGEAPREKAAPQQGQQAKQAANRPTTRVPEKKLVDTRKAGNVNLARYDEHLENLAPERANKMQSGKQKIQSRGNHRKGGNFGNKRRQEEQEKMRRLQLEIAKKTPLTVKIPDEIGVGELASRMKKTGADVVKQLMKLGVMASLSEIIDYDTAALVAMELGCKVEKEVIVTIEEKLIDTAEDKEEDLAPRAPVVVVMGHVDHGKTSLLDYIRNSQVAEGEAGGITQHIGAYQVTVTAEDGTRRPITFIDTPGHEAFTAMRARGAQVTDIAILVVAADDGVMPQTVEAINHAQAAGVPIVVAVNKVDKDSANPEKIRSQLTEYGLVAEEYGGDVMFVNISAKQRTGIRELLEAVLLTADAALTLEANPNTDARGVAIEANLDKGRGAVATMLVQRGTLRVGDSLVVGSSYGRVRAMFDDAGNDVSEAGPSTPVAVLGLTSVPRAGDSFLVAPDDRTARQIADKREAAERQALLAKRRKRVSLEDFDKVLAEGEVDTLNLVIKGDVSGAVEALEDSLLRIDVGDEVALRIIHRGVGAITQNDVNLATVDNAVIIGFNVRPAERVAEMADAEGVEIKYYNVIYSAIDDIEAALKGMLKPIYEEVQLGTAEIRQVFRSGKFGNIAGSIVRSGTIKRGTKARLVRDGVVVADNLEIASLRREKDDVTEVREGYECGITLGYKDIAEGDVIETWEMREKARD